MNVEVRFLKLLDYIFDIINLPARKQCSNVEQPEIRPHLATMDNDF